MRWNSQRPRPRPRIWMCGCVCVCMLIAYHRHDARMVTLVCVEWTELSKWTERLRRPTPFNRIYLYSSCSCHTLRLILLSSLLLTFRIYLVRHRAIFFFELCFACHRPWMANDEHKSKAYLPSWRASDGGDGGGTGRWSERWKYLPIIIKACNENPSWPLNSNYVL